MNKLQIAYVGVPQITVNHRVICKIMSSIGAYPPETGGILLGPIGTSQITDFYFDASARCTGATYSPDHVTLKRKLQEEWIPAGIDFKGFCHSHPGSFDRLSDGDLRYIRHLLERNSDIEAFAAPIVIPGEFRLRPIVVLRDSPGAQHPTSFRILPDDSHA